MTPNKFKSLKVGDKVTLKVDARAYGFSGYVPAGTTGTVGAVKVPAVFVNRYFVCVDFPAETPLVRVYGCVENPHRNRFRVAAYAEELE